MKLCCAKRCGNAYKPRLLPSLRNVPYEKIALGEYPGVTAWSERIKALPGYFPVPALRKS